METLSCMRMVLLCIRVVCCMAFQQPVIPPLRRRRLNPVQINFMSRQRYNYISITYDRILMFPNNATSAPTLTQI